MVPDPVDGNAGDPGRYVDPPTMLLPVVPPLYAVDSTGDPGGYAPSGVDPYAPASFVSGAAEEPGETTTWWSAPVTGPYEHDDGALYDDPGYDPYDPYEAYGHGVEDSGPYHLLRPDHQPEPVSYRQPGRYRPVTDSGRHHHRLAPAGW